MNKQLRIIIGDNGSEFASGCAAALHRAGDWAILRQQQYDMLLRAVRTEHPDMLILDAADSTMHFPEFAAEVLTFSDVMILAFYQTRDRYLEKNLQRLGVRYLPKSDLGTNRVQYLHRIAGSQPLIRQRVTVPEQKPELSVTRLLNSLGISANLRGYHYLRCAILIASEFQTCSGCMMNMIYPTVAEKMNSTPSRVERSIRHAILQAWEHSGSCAGWQYGLHIDHRMTNSEFISYAVEWLHTDQACREMLL